MTDSDKDRAKIQTETKTRSPEREREGAIERYASRQRQPQKHRTHRYTETGTDKKRELPPSLQDYLKKREAEIEMYKSISPELRPYYKYLVDKYYKALKSN